MRRPHHGRRRRRRRARADGARTVPSFAGLDLEPWQRELLDRVVTGEPFDYPLRVSEQLAQRRHARLEAAATGLAAAALAGETPLIAASSYRAGRDLLRAARRVLDRYARIYGAVSLGHAYGHLASTAIEIPGKELKGRSVTYEDADQYAGISAAVDRWAEQDAVQYPR